MGYLDNTGLGYFWGKVKGKINDNLATIRVTTMAGCTIDILSSGIIIASYTLVGQETTHEFKGFGYGTYVARVSLGSVVSPVTVNVDSMSIFDVTITLQTILYNQGDENEEITGGWIASDKTYRNIYTRGAPTITRGTTSLTATANTTGSITIVNNYIDFTPYNTLNIEVITRATSQSWNYCGLFLVSSDTNPLYPNAIKKLDIPNTGRKTLDLSSVTGYAYLYIALESGGDHTDTFTFSSLTLNL